MKKYLLVVFSLLFVNSVLFSQEKRSFNELEYKKFYNTVASDTIRSDNMAYLKPNRDTLKVDGETYLLLNSPVDFLDNADRIFYDNARRVGERVVITGTFNFRKRYTLTFEIIEDSLYVSDFHLAPDYDDSGDRTKKDVVEAIEDLLGKKVEDGKIKVDWLSLDGCHDCVFKLYAINTETEAIYSFQFENNLFVQKERRDDVRLKEMNLPRIEDLRVPKK